ncbi:MAG: amidohydrolase family protein [Pirellulaceae bacterium]|nr:amidohydrolase family protein [Pirellulaceae bacterium]
MIIDSHQHFWDRSDTRFDNAWQDGQGLQKICRSFLPGDLQPCIQTAGVDATVFVQTQHNLEENRWALSLAKQHDFIAGIVGWVDLTSPACGDQLAEFRGQPKFVGIRHVVQDEPDEDFIIREDVFRGLAELERQKLPFDLLFYERHLKHAATVASHFPNLPLVINHLAKPNIKQGSFEEWKKQLQAAAEHENVFCKLSGMVTEADWQDWRVEQLRPYAETAIECFGPERLMYGSDWPVCNLAADYSEVFAAARQLIASLSQHEQAMILGETARRFYQLPTVQGSA